jgi:hypothetical protein
MIRVNTARVHRHKDDDDMTSLESRSRLHQLAGRGMVAALFAVLPVVAIACGDDNSSTADTTATTGATTGSSATTSAQASTSMSGPTVTASAATCAARDQLKTSFENLADVNVVQNGTSAIGDQLDVITDNLDELRSNAGDDLQPQIDEFQQSLDALREMTNNGSVPVGDTADAVGKVVTSGTQLMTSLANLDCG